MERQTNQLSEKSKMEVQNCLESFLNIGGDKATDLTGPPSVQVVRSSNSTYKMLNEKYMMRRNTKDHMLQYATLYFQRLEKLRPTVKEAAQMKWAQDDDQFIDGGVSKVQFVDNILDIKPFTETVIIGTFFKEQKQKPSILNNIMGTLGQKKFEDVDGKFLHASYVDSENDTAVLEDISGRITIKNSVHFNINYYVSGSAMALKGQAKAGGYFEVKDQCFAGVPFCTSVPKELNLIGKQRDMFDPEALKPNSGREFVALISGLKFGFSQTTHFQTDFLLRFFKGELGSTSIKGNQEIAPESRVLASQIKRVIIAGDSMVQPEQIDEVLRGSYRTNKLNTAVYQNISDVIDSFENFLDTLSETIDVDVMPGEQDFSNSFMPQQPFNSCIFPKLAERQRESINLVTNPHQFEINGLTFLGTSGQNIRDMMLNSVERQDQIDMTDDNDVCEKDGSLCIEKMKETLSMRHLCPTAPDTLRVYPFKESDPFVMAQENSDLVLESQVASTQQHGQTATDGKYSSFPHVYFAGNMLSYKSELMLKTKNPRDGFVKVISVPQFVKTSSIVLLDLQTMESQEIKFDISEELFGQKLIEETEKRRSAINDSARAKISVDTQMID